jgi:hypothetical protein
MKAIDKGDKMAILFDFFYNRTGVIEFHKDKYMFETLYAILTYDNETNMFLVNAPRVQFGLDKNGSAEPVVKGEQLDDILTEIMQALADYSDMVTALAISPPLLASASGFLKGRFQEIKLKLDDFKSPTSFTI